MSNFDVAETGDPSTIEENFVQSVCSQLRQLDESGDSEESVHYLTHSLAISMFVLFNQLEFDFRQCSGIDEDGEVVIWFELRSPQYVTPVPVEVSE